MSYYSESELREMGIGDFGERVRISRKASIYGWEKLSVGNDVRIDDFCVISVGRGRLIIGSYVHIAVFSLMIGRGAITISDFCNLSSRVSIYSSSDDYSGNWMTNPTVPTEYTRVTHEDVFLGKHVIIGSGSVVLPGVAIEDGVAVGALSLVKSRCEAFGMYVGTPAKRVRERSRNLLQMEEKLRAKLSPDL
jgi:dTDP-4-amino-4,6-dideoxy-D-glucose acyltransferase